MSQWRALQRDHDISAWEAEYLDSADRRLLSQAEMRAVVDYVYGSYGLPYPPPVRMSAGPSDHEHVEGAYACATETGIVAMQPINTVTLLHEVAHHMTESTLHRMELRRMVERHVHGDVWLSNYLQLLDRFMGPQFNQHRLRATLPACVDQANLRYYLVLDGQPFVPAGA